ncbi:MAG: hypothetical protein H5T62_01070 [Anaerolineae bacterium]|nr:hypothetical protein [Anaerolineae bacterium]
MNLKLLFPNEIEELAAALDGISAATAQAAQEGSESLRAFRLGVQVTLAAMVKATGGQSQPIKPRDPMNQINRAHRLTSPCPLKGVYAGQANGYYCRFYQGRCPMLEDLAYNYLDCPGWHNYEAERQRNVCFG